MSLSACKIWWPGTELNRRRQPFQGCALPPELPGHFLSAHLLAASLAVYWALSLGGMPSIKTADALGPCGTLEL